MAEQFRLLAAVSMPYPACGLKRSSCVPLGTVPAYLQCICSILGYYRAANARGTLKLSTQEVVWKKGLSPP
jgi:hypothetical protein